VKFDAQLLKWAQTSNGGFTATLVFSDEDAAREYFQPQTLAKGKQAGQLFSVEFTELDEHGNDQKPTPRRMSGGPICQRLVLWCDDQLFREWCGATNKYAAEVWIKATLEVDSRKQVDGNEALEKRFHERIRGPYAAWLAEHIMTTS
jgi:hypothetical protein